MRKKHVTAVCKNPKAKPRHEAIDVKHFTNRKKSSYVDFFQARELSICEIQIAESEWHWHEPKQVSRHIIPLFETKPPQLATDFHTEAEAICLRTV